MAEDNNLIPLNPAGNDAIKGNIFFGNNLTPGGTFSNIPQTVTSPLATQEQQAKITLTLAQIQEELRRNAQEQERTTEDVLSDQAINVFLQNYVKLLMDYSDLRNFVFFGSAYTELVYHVNFLIKNYPYLGYFAKNVGSTAVDPLNTIQLTSLPGNETQVTFQYPNLLQKGQYVYDNSGETIWTDYELVDVNGNRFPITQVDFTQPTLSIVNATNTSPIVIQTSQAHGLSAGEKITIQNVLGNTAANGEWKILISPISASPTALTIGVEYRVLSSSIVHNSITYYKGQVFTAVNTTFSTGNVALANEFALQNSHGDVTLTNGVYTPASGEVVLPYIAISDASATSPITITTITPHNLNNGDIVKIEGVLGNTAANGEWTINSLAPNTFELVNSTYNGTYLGSGLFINKLISYTVEGNITVNNLIEYIPTTGVLFRGLFVSPKLQVINDFYVNLESIQKELLKPTNITPWPRDIITNNILFEGAEFEAWVNNPSTMVSDYQAEDLGVISTDFSESLNLTGAITLDETKTNQLIRRAIPHRVVDELRDTDDKLFSRFVLLAGKMFDLIKVYIDFLKYTKSLNYTPFNQLSPDFYKLYAEHYGFDLFDDDTVSLAQAIIITEPGLAYDQQNNATFSDQNTAQTKQDLQYEKQKRLLLNLFYLYQTKGTIVCIEKLVNLLGSPEGLVLLKEYSFNNTTGAKIVDNDKIKVPKIEYEIDPDYLIDSTNINNPVNLPYVYRLKLDNESIVNLREFEMYTDPQSAIQTQVINYGQTTYPYGNFKTGAFANLQNINSSTGEYALLPLTFPDKYCGITVEYMIPRSGYIKGVGQGFDETSIHLASLYEVDDIVYNGNEPVFIPTSTQFAPLTPVPFEDNLQSDIVPLSLRAKTSFILQNLGPNTDLLEVYVNTIPIGGILWQSDLKQTALALVNAINFSQTAVDFVALYQENYDSTFTITIETRYNNDTLNGSLVEVMSNATLATSYVDNSQLSMSNDVNPGLTNYNQFIIARLEGKDLVVRAYLRSETSTIHPLATNYIAKLNDVFSADGLNHTLRLVYRPEGIEVYQDYKYISLMLWRDVSTHPSGVYTSLNCPHSEIENCTVTNIDHLFAYPDNDPTSGVSNVSGEGNLTITNVNGTINNIVVYVGGFPQNAPFNFIGTDVALLAADIETAINSFSTDFTASVIPGDNKVTITQNVPDVLGNGQVITMSFDNSSGNDIDFISYNIEGAIDNNSGTNPFIDKPRWWDLLIGLPVNIDMYFKKVAVFEAPSIDHPDSLDFGVATSGFDSEKFSFNFVNQITDTSNVYLSDRISVQCQFRAQFPYPAGATSNTSRLDLFFSAYPTDLVSDITLVNQTYKGGKVLFTEDIQNFFVLPNNETVTIDSLFTWNGWSPSIHQDYNYDNYNKVYENYQLFSEQVLTYLSLLPFIELIESKFKVLVSQFIPIVINISQTGRLIRALERNKVRYVNVHKICEGTQIESPAIGTLRITNGTNNNFSSTNNNITVSLVLRSSILSASNTPIITIQTTETHNLTTGNTVIIQNVLGNTAANGTWVITVTGLDTFTIPIAGNGTHIPETGDTEYEILTSNTIDWNFTNSYTASQLAADINSAYSPLITCNSGDNDLVLQGDYILFESTYSYDINKTELKVIVNGNVRVDSVSGFSGGIPGISGTGTCFTVQFVPVLGENLPVGDIDQLIYYSSEQGPESYIYYQSEMLDPIYIYYDIEETI